MVWLITNWHIVTGRSPNNPRSSRTGAIPTTLRVKAHQRQPGGGIVLSEKRFFELEINDPDGDAPRWREHPTLGHRFDVVAIPLKVSEPPLDQCEFNTITEHPTFVPDFYPEVMMDTFVLGYPWGLDGGDQVLPIFKRGSVATEPSVDQGNLPRFLIDCRTAPGLSGAPAIASDSGLWSPPHLNGDYKLGTVQNFVGCYSGRLTSKIPGDVEKHSANDEPTVSELGIVWKRAGIDAIVCLGIQGISLKRLIAQTQ